MILAEVICPRVVVPRGRLDAAPIIASLQRGRHLARQRAKGQTIAKNLLMREALLVLSVLSGKESATYLSLANCEMQRIRVSVAKVSIAPLDRCASPYLENAHESRAGPSASTTPHPQMGCAIRKTIR